MTSKISKKFIIVMSAFVAIVLLTAWLIVSGTAENIYFYFVVMNTHVEPEGGIHLLDDLKPGKYLLQRDWGLDETDYIEVFDDHTVQFIGSYWSDSDAKMKAKAAESSESEETWGPYFSERNAYEMGEHLEFVHVAGSFVGFSYTDENTLEVTRARDEINDVTDYNHEANRPSVPRYQEEIVIAHYIYVEQ